MQFIIVFCIVAPKITEDLDYTRNNNGDGVFSVTSCGTNLTHKWYKNGGLINRTGDNILEISDTSLRVKEINGSLRIAYEVSNVDYDNTPHSMRQTFGVYSHVSCTNGGITDNSMQMILIAVSIIMGSAICILTIICLILFIYLQKKNKSTSKRTVEFDDITVPESSDNMQCDEVDACEPDERLYVYALRMVKDCNTDTDFLELLQQLLLMAKNKKKYSNKFRELCNTMFYEVGAIMEEIESQEGDGTGLDTSKLICCKYNINITLYLFLGNEHLLDDDQHYRYNQYQDIRKILQEIAKC